MTAVGSYAILLLPLLLSLINFKLSLGGEIIKSQRVTNWGQWGAFQRCPAGTLVQGFKIRTEPYRGGLIDDTAVNALRLYCGDPGSPNSTYISSTEGHWGDWGEVFKCPDNGFIYGFQARVEAHPFLFDDETAKDNFRFYCTSQPPDTFLEGDGLNRFGAWRAVAKCSRTEGLCALQTQVERDQGLGDDTALNNIDAECCSIS